jgi:hypothetical protein
MDFVRYIIDFVVSLFSRKSNIKNEIKKDNIIKGTKGYLEQEEEAQRTEEKISEVHSSDIKKETQTINFG